MPLANRKNNAFHTSSNHGQQMWQSTHPLSVLSPRRVQRLDKVCGMAEEECVARGAADHGQHGQPHVRERLWREAAVSDTQHVGHRFEQRPRILFQPERLLKHHQSSVELRQCLPFGMDLPYPIYNKKGYLFLYFYSFKITSNLFNTMKKIDKMIWGELLKSQHQAEKGWWVGRDWLMKSLI